MYVYVRVCARAFDAISKFQAASSLFSLNIANLARMNGNLDGATKYIEAVQ